jgi:hypothetical protein
MSHVNAQDGTPGSAFDDDLLLVEMLDEKLGDFDAVLRHSFCDAPHRAHRPFNPHRARVPRNHGRLPSNGFIERAQNTAPVSTNSPKTHLR